MFLNSLHLNIDGLVTDADWESLPDSIQIEGYYKGDLSGKRPRKNLLAMYHLSDKFWTHERLEKEHHRFFGVCTLLGKSPRKGPIDGSDLYLNGIDPDSGNVRDLLFDEILARQDLAAKTFVTKTHKSWHAFWLSHKQNPPLFTKQCKPGSEVELKTNLSSMTLTLPTTRHRKHRDFKYERMSSTNQIITSDTLYGTFISVLDSKGHLIETPTFESEGRDGKNRKKVSPENILKEDSRRALTQAQIDDAIIILATESGGSYSPDGGSRNTCTLHYGAYFFKSNIKLESTQAFCTGLCAYTNDDELTSRLKTIENTYDRGYNGESIKGKSGLLEVFKRFNNNDSDLAENILKILLSTWH
jgi:hypothetical protein